jgi:hypothetical protein
MYWKELPDFFLMGKLSREEPIPAFIVRMAVSMELVTLMRNN